MVYLPIYLKAISYLFAYYIKNKFSTSIYSFFPRKKNCYEYQYNILFGIINIQHTYYRNIHKINQAENFVEVI